MFTHIRSLIFLIIPILVFTFPGLSVHAQLPSPLTIKKDHSKTDWFLEIQKIEPNFKQAKNLYDAYFKDHANEKSIQRKIAIRWFQTNVNNQNKEGIVKLGLISGKETEKFMRLNAVKNTNQQNLRVANSPFPSWNDMTGSWRMIGPYHNKIVPCDNGYSMSGGFVDRVYINPYNTQNLFSGQSNGGLWVSKDQGGTWKLTDAEFPNGKNTYSNRDVYYGEIEAAKTNANLVYAATEAGVLKSSNGGDNWTLVNDLNYVTRSTERAYFIAISNTDPNMVLASYGSKIYRSINGGTSWNMVFDNSAGGSAYITNGSTTGLTDRKYNIAGLSFHPTKNNIVYLAARNAAEKTQVYISRNFGQTFNILLNTNRTEHFKMEVVPSAPNRIYLFEMFPSLENTQTRTGIIKYDTSGVKIQEINYPVIGHLLDDCTVSPTDSSVLYLGGYSSGELHKSTNGGLTFNTNNPGFKNCDPGKYIHPDIRAIQVVGDVVLVGSDGGTSLSTDGANTFNNVGQYISAIDLWGFASAFKGDKVGSGDNHGPTEMRWFDVEGGWEHTGGADSQDITLNPAQPNWIYAADVYRKFKMVTNDNTYGTPTAVLDATLKYLAIHPNVYGKAYPFKDNRLLVSEDNMLTASDTLYTFTENISKVKIPTKNPAIMYVLVDKNKVFKSINAGLSFDNITPSTTITLGKTTISDIDVSSDGQTVRLSYGEVQNLCKVVKTTNGGGIWNNYSTGLPFPTASNITSQRGTNGGAYLVTDGGGVWFRDNAMSSWSLLGTGLPMLGYVTSSYVVPDKKVFRMGTSRGAFEHELAFNTTADALIAVDYTTKTTCNKDTAYFRDFSAYQGTTNIQFQWTFEGGVPATSNLMNPKVLYPNVGIFDVALTIIDANGVSSSQLLSDFMNISPMNCGIDTLSGLALKTTQQDQYISAGSSLTNPNAYTIMAWVKGNGPQVDYAGILSLKTTTDEYVFLNARDQGDSTQLGYHHPEGAWWWDSGLFLKQNIWTHVALVVEPTVISVVKDGIRASHTGLAVNNAVFNKFAIGTMLNYPWARNFIGEIDEVAVYKRALTDDEIRKMMHLTKNNPKYPSQQDADLIHYYQFNEANLAGGIFDRVGTKPGIAISNPSLVNSTAPVGSGVFQHVNTALTRGVNTFNVVGLSIKTPALGALPSVPLTIYRLDNRPYPIADSLYKNYWIWRNWTGTKSFAAIDSLSFENISMKSSDVANPANFKMHYRPITSYSSDWIFSNIKANDSGAAGISFRGLALNTYGQLVLSRRATPCTNNTVLSGFNSLSKQLVQSSNSLIINGNSKINQGNKVIFNAGQSILLLPSFETKPFATFTAEIKGCDNN